MTTIVELDPMLADVMRSAARDEVTLLPSAESLEEHLAQHPEEQAVVLGPSVDDAQAAGFAGRQRIVRPALGVILVRVAVSSDVLTEALRCGVREVVATSDASGLRDALDRVGAVSRAMREGAPPAPGIPAGRRGGLVTVFSTKGGVGKSLVATNLAAALADLGHRVCIVDLDINGGDVSLMLQLSPAHTLADLAGIAADLDTSGVQSLLVEDRSGLAVLAAPVHLGTPVPAEPAAAVLQILKQLFDIVVVDTSGAFDDCALGALDHTDLLLLVGTLDIPALKSLKLATGTLDLLNVPRSRWRILLNRADPKVGLSVGEFAETLGLPVATSLASSRDVLTAVNRGEVLVRTQRTHPFSKTVVGLARSVVEDLGQSTGPEPTLLRRGGHLRLRSRKGA